jgi:myo-inositol 2-dehydrogenase/D-chiro-inositol 1-dehydrogenase
VIRIAVVGAGRIGSIHTQNVLAAPQTTLTWLADPNIEAANRLAQQAPHVRVTTEPVEAATAADVDAVIVASPTPTHVDLIKAAVAAGKAVLCEKPIDLDLDRARDCLVYVAARGGRAMMGFNRRFDPTFAEIHTAVGQGRIGKVEQLTIISRDLDLAPLDYLTSSGGMFRDMTIHDLDMARWFLGPITEVQATGQNIIDPRVGDIGDIDAGVVVATAESGAVATIVNARRCAFGYDQRLEVFGSSGMLQAANQAPTTVRTTLAHSTDAGPRYEEFFLQRYAASYRRELDAFVSGIAADAVPPPSLFDGVAALELADAAQTSLGKRGAVAIPPSEPPGT